jgi:hypothetical protein
LPCPKSQITSNRKAKLSKLFVLGFLNFKYVTKKKQTTERAEEKFFTPAPQMKEKK